MKKKVVIIFSLALSILLLSASLVAGSSDSEKYSQEKKDDLKINGVTFDVPKPFKEDGYVVVPLRAVAEALDFIVDWNPQLQSVSLHRDNTNIEIFINSSKCEYATINSKKTPLFVKPVLRDNYTMVCSKLFTDIIGFNDLVKYDEKAGEITAERKKVVSIPGITDEDIEGMVLDLYEYGTDFISEININRVEPICISKERKGYKDYLIEVNISTEGAVWYCNQKYVMVLMSKGSNVPKDKNGYSVGFSCNNTYLEYELIDVDSDGANEILYITT